MSFCLDNNSVWITWERQTRNRSASSFFNVKLFEVLESTSSRTLRYIKSIFKTYLIIIRHKPKFVFVQNPSVVLCLSTLILRVFLRYKLIVDAHNSGVYGPEGSSLRLIGFLNKIILKNADLVIVTNDLISEYIASNGAKVIVLPDPLPAIDTASFNPSLPSNGTLKALCITSWGADEPIEEIIKAASRFGGVIDFYFSGNFKKFSAIQNMSLPENIHLLGFVDEEVYFSHLLSSDFCIDLTERMDCMVCGAYESISAGKPIILSNTDVQKRYFSKGAVFCENKEESIGRAIECMADNISKYKNEAELLKNEVLNMETKRKPEHINLVLNL